MWLVAILLNSSTTVPPLSADSMKVRERRKNCTQIRGN